MWLGGRARYLAVGDRLGVGQVEEGQVEEVEEGQVEDVEGHRGGVVDGGCTAGVRGSERGRG